MSRASKILESLSKKTKKFNESWTKRSVENLRDRIFSDLKLVVEDEYEKRKDNSRLHPQDILAAAEQRANAALEVVYKLDIFLRKAILNLMTLILNLMHILRL